MAKIMRVGVLKTALFLGLFMVFIGLITGLLSAVATSLVSLPDYIPTSVLSVTGYFGILILPIGYGISGFVFGLVFALIINFVLKIIKGFSLEIDMTSEPSPVKPISTTTQTAQAVAPVKKVSIPKI